MMGTEVADQSKYLEEAIKKVKEQAFYMKHAMDHNDLKGTLTHASDMLRELRTGLLTPKNYYELFMKVLDELRYLEDYFLSMQKSGKPVVELYERVQSCGNVLPRLYLLITVAGVYIKSMEAPARDILRDLVEMSKGVQHPMRGLFLRNYLSQVTRDKLPDVGTSYEGEGGTVQDACDFILQNFSETNRLWVRMQNQGNPKDKKKREKERQELRILVGTNLVRLSQLQGVDGGEYKDNILPRILEQVTNCKDTIAQSYLMDCIIQVFPDEYHLGTLDQFLTTCTQLKEKVNVRAILESMMDRLANFADSNPESIPQDLKTFQMFNDCVSKLLQERTNFSVVEVLRLQSSLLNYALKCYPGRLDYVNHCIGNCADILEAKQGESAGLDLDGVEVVERLLTLPLSTLALRVLELERYSSLLKFLPWSNRKQVSVTLVSAIFSTKSTLTDFDSIDKLFQIILPVIRSPESAAQSAGSSGEGGEADEEAANPDFEDEQLLVARLVHVMISDDTDTLFRFLGLARKYLGQGGPKRIQYTLPPLVFAALRLSGLVRKRELAAASASEGEGESSQPPLQYGCRKIFQFMHEVVSALKEHNADLALKLFLQCAQAADHCDFKLIAYEFVSQAFILYEDELTDSKTQIRALSSMVGTLLKCRNFDESDYDALITKTTQYAAKLLKKPDQCRMVTVCSHLFWVGKEDDPKKYHDSRRVIECLQRSVRTADICMASSQHVHLFVDVLNHYLYFYEHNCPTVTDKFVTALVALIRDKMSEAGPSEARGEVEAHYHNTLAYIERKQQNPETRERFANIDIDPPLTS